MQVQKAGSYRSEDMVEALDWMLPVASSPEESIIVLLDWFSGHLTEEVEELIRSKGHVLLFHGGGITPFTQINDTHLHAVLAQSLIEFENKAAEKTRKDRLARGNKKMPSVKHEDLICLVQCAWMAIDHERIAEKGYKQTGPTMPMTGSVKPEDVFHDLLDVLNAIDPDSTPLEVSLKTVREDAIAYVNKGKEDGIWADWDDYYMLIEPHDNEDPGVEEGLEALRPVADYSDDDHNEQLDESCSDDSEASGDESDGDQPSDDADDSSDSDDPNGKDDDSVCVEAGSAVEDASMGDKQPSTDEVALAPQPIESPPGDEELKALQLLYDKAKLSKNDTALKFYRQELRQVLRDQHDGAQPSAVLLRKRAQAQHEEDLKAGKRHKEEERLVAAKAKDQKTAEILAEADRREKKQKEMEQAIIKRKFEEERNQAKQRAKLTRCWLQTVFPAMLADRCIVMYTQEMKPSL